MKCDAAAGLYEIPLNLLFSAILSWTLLKAYIPVYVPTYKTEW